MGGLILNTWQVSVIISGTSIGAGMLALPSVTAGAGFGFALLGQALVYLVTLLSGLYLAEICLWAEDENVHMASLGRRFLGRPGEVGVLFFFLFFYNCLLISYFSGLYPLVGKVGENLGFVAHQHPVYMVVLAVSVMGILGLSMPVIGSLSSWLMAGLVATFVAMIFGAFNYIQFDHLAYLDRGQFSLMLPTLLGAFGFHNVVPSIVQRFSGNRSQLYRALGVGLLGPFLIYVIWQVVVLGTLSPQQIMGVSGSTEGVPLLEALSGSTALDSLSYLIPFFTFFAIITSIIGVGISLVDFFKDLFAVNGLSGSKSLYIAMTVIPPSMIGYFFPNLFVKLFAYAAGIGGGMLNIVFPSVAFLIGIHAMGRRSELPIVARHHLSLAAVILCAIWFMFLSLQ